MSRFSSDGNGSSDFDAFELPAIPSSWCWATPRELAASDGCSLAIGPFGSNLKVSDYRDCGVPLVFVRNIRSCQYGGTSTKYVSQAKAEQLAAHTVDPGDVLITKMGDPPGDADIYPDGEPRAVITADCIKFRVNPRLGLPRFYAYAINSRIGRSQIALITKGVAQQKVSLGRFAQLRFPLPPLAEQRRIVAKIEELFSDLDAAVAALKRAKSNLTSYRAAVLKAAVEGKLTAEWRAKNPTEPASKLLERILAERRRKWEADQLAKFAAAHKEPPKNWKAKYVEPKTPETSGLPELPAGWCWADGAQLFAWSSGDFLPRANQNEGNVPVFGGNGITGFHDRANVTSQTIVIGRVGVHCGNVHIAQGDAWITDNAIFATALPFNCNVKYLVLCLENANLKSLSQGGAQPFVNQRMLMDIVIPLPPPSEQDEIAAEFERRFSLADDASHCIETSVYRATRLRQEILNQAFEGKLVPQDPCDEPARTILERLRVTHRLHDRNGQPAPQERIHRRRERQQTNGANS